MRCAFPTCLSPVTPRGWRYQTDPAKQFCGYSHARASALAESAERDWADPPVVVPMADDPYTD